jgi:hypothetical protein
VSATIGSSTIAAAGSGAAFVAINANASTGAAICVMPCVMPDVRCEIGCVRLGMCCVIAAVPKDKCTESAVVLAAMLCGMCSA